MLCVAIAPAAACAAPSAFFEAKDSFYFAGAQPLRPGWTAHFGGFQNIGSEFATRLAARDPAVASPVTLPDPAAFVEHFEGPLPADAFQNAGPEFIFPDAPNRELLCLRNLNAILFTLEAGLRLTYCTHATRDETQAVRRTIAQIQGGAGTRGAYPRYSGESIAIQVITPAELRRRLGNDIRVSIDGGRTARLADWRLASPTAHFAYDIEATRDGGREAWPPPSPSIANSSNAASSDNAAHPLPRRFPGGEFYCLLTGEALHLLYEIESDPGQLLVVSIHDDHAVREAAASFALLPELLARHIRDSRSREVVLSEIYFRNQSSGSGAIVDEFFEIASGSADVTARIAWQGDDAFESAPDGTTESAWIERNVFLFAHSTRIVERSLAFRFQRKLRFRPGEATDAVTIDLDRLPRPEFSHRSWSHTFRPGPDSAGALEGPGSMQPAPGLTASTLCRGDLARYRRLCANPGIAPALARSLALQRARFQANQMPHALPPCRLQDFALSEFNPTGIYVPPPGVGGQGSVAADGKFVELRVARACRTAGLYFRIGEKIADPGSTALSVHRPLLLIATRDPARYLDLVPAAQAGEAVAAGAAKSTGPDIFSVPALRFATAADEIAVHALPLLLPVLEEPSDAPDPGGTSRVLRATPENERLYWSGPGAAVESIGGAPSIFRAVHSLQYAGAGTQAREAFARGAGRGLRPDLREWNAMSPGQLSGLADANATEQRAIAPKPLYPEVRISEILPAGGYDANGTSLPAEEFIEIHAYSSPEHGSAHDASLEVRITKASTLNTIHQAIRLPLPERDGYFVFQRGTSRCFAHNTGGRVARLSELSLPNGPANYALHRIDATHSPALAPLIDASIIDAFTIDSFAYADLNPPRLRRSVSRFAGETAFPEFARPTDGAAAVSPYCGAATSATPGAPPSFAAFVLRDPADSHRLRLYNESTPLPLSLAYSDGNLSSAWSVQTPLYKSHGDAIDLPVPPLPETGPGPRLIYTVHANDRLLGAGESFAREIPLQIHSVAPTPAAGHVEWLRLCSPDGFSPTAYSQPGSRSSASAGASTNESLQLFVADSRSADRIVPHAERFETGPRAFATPQANPLPGTPFAFRTIDSLELAPGECAILVDPDYAGQTLPLIPADRALWTIADSSAIGNGLSSGEGLRVYLATANQAPAIPLCSYGRPDLPDPFAIHTDSGRYVSRTFDLAASSPFDERQFFQVIAP